MTTEGTYCVGSAATSVDRGLGQELLRVILASWSKCQHQGTGGVKCRHAAPARSSQQPSFDSLETRLEKAFEQYDAVPMPGNRLVVAIGAALETRSWRRSKPQAEGLQP